MSGNTRSLRGKREDSGFTLIELLVVLVIIPLIIGGIAEAIIVSFESETATQNRLSDSVNAQLTSDFLARDVQGASYLTTLDNSALGGPYAFNAPQVCKPSSGAGTLLLALFRPKTATDPDLDLGYWLDTVGSSSEIDRYSCTLTASPNFTSVSPVLTAVANPVAASVSGPGSEAITATTDILPQQFGNGATLQWVPSGAFTTAGAIPNLSLASTITVGTTAGFTPGTTAAGVLCAPSSTQTSASGCVNPPQSPLMIDTSSGPAQVTCTGFTLTSFTGCSSASTGAVTNNSNVTQSAVSSVQLSVTEPSSSYRFNLVGVPRANAPQLRALGSNGPTLLTLGTSGVNPINGGGSGTCPDAARANLCVGSGGVIVDSGGTVFCNGAGPHTYIHFEDGNGSIDTVAPGSASSCNTVQVGPTGGIPDPLKNFLPNGPPGCLSNSFVNSLPSGSTVLGISTPGVYSGGSKPSGKLEPGVYVVETGIGTITGMTVPLTTDQYYHPTASAPYYSLLGAPFDAGAGVLIYVPGPGPFKASDNCFTFSPTALSGAIGTSSPVLGPLDSTQSTDYFQGNNILSGTWLWQDSTNTNTIALTGQTTSTLVAGNTSDSLLYAPGAQFQMSGGATMSTGSMYIGGLHMNGTDTLILGWT